jgi:hypothetical protein
MPDLSCKFTRDDIETLIEAMGDWEMLGNHEFHVMSMIKNAPMPPEDHEAYEALAQIKEHFQNRERDIMASRAVRQEKAVFLKAKLMLVRSDLGITALFDMTSNTDANSPMPKKEEAKPVEPRVKRSKSESSDQVDYKAKLEMAEFFIKDLGVQSHYEKFLAEKAAAGNTAGTGEGEEVLQS